MTSRLWGRATGLALAMLAAGGAVEAQTSTDVANRCTAAGGAEARCASAAATVAWMTSGAGLLASGSTLAPDQHRTLGRRTPDGTPRTALDVRIAFAPLAHPSMTTANNTPIDRTQVGLGVGAAVGVFDGLQLYPAVGGVLSVDALLAYTWIRLPEDQGYESSANIRSLGARLGLLRESFSAPGIAVTLMRSWGDPLIFTGAPGVADEEEVVNVDPTTTALRLAIGKDLFGLGLHAAVGRDWMKSVSRIGVSGAVDGMAVLDAEYDHARTVAQAGASLNFLVVRVQGDVGWALGDSGPAVVGLDAESASMFGSFSVRFLF